MASSSLRAPDAPPGFKWILVCENCKYCYCSKCLTCCIKSSPACKDILNKWVQSKNHYTSYLSYFRSSQNLTKGIISGGPMQGQVYIYLYTPCISYEDFCAIMIQTKNDSLCQILFDCSTFRDSHIWWSGWLYLLFWTYCPRDILFFGSSEDVFKHWFQVEVEEATHYKAWFVFNLSFQGGEFIYDKFDPPNPQSYKVTISFYGDNIAQQFYPCLLLAMGNSSF